MTVGELIEKLAKHDLDWPAVVASRHGYGWEEVETVLSFPAEKDGGEVAVVSLTALTGDIHGQDS